MTIYDSIVGEYLTNSTQHTFLKSKVEQHKLIEKMLPVLTRDILTDKQRIVFNLYAVEHKSQAEIAKQLELSQPTISRHLNHAIDNLNHYLYYILISHTEGDNNR